MCKSLKLKIVAGSRAYIVIRMENFIVGNQALIRIFLKRAILQISGLHMNILKVYVSFPLRENHSPNEHGQGNPEQRPSVVGIEDLQDVEYHYGNQHKSSKYDGDDVGGSLIALPLVDIVNGELHFLPALCTPNLIVDVDLRKKLLEEASLMAEQIAGAQ
jgi:hypothetical protein